MMSLMSPSVIRERLKIGVRTSEGIRRIKNLAKCRSSNACATSRDEAVFGEGGTGDEVRPAPFHEAPVEHLLAIKPDPHGALDLGEDDVEYAEEFGGGVVERVVELLAGEDGRSWLRI